MEPLQAAGESDIQTYLRILTRRKLTIAVTTAVLVALALAYSFLTTPTYSASAQVLIPQQSATNALVPAADQAPPAAASLQRTLADAQQFAQGDATKQAAVNALHYDAPITVTASTSADVLTFTANSSNKAQAAAVANAYAKAYISASEQSEVAQYSQEVQTLTSAIAQQQDHLKALPPGNSQQAAADQSAITSLSQSLQQLEAVSELVSNAGGTVVAAATVPASPSSPQPLRNALLGLLVGLLLGVGFAFLRDRLDDKIKSLRDAEEHSAGRPVIGTIPLVDGWSTSDGQHLALLEDPNSPVSEAYRTLRTAILFLGLDEPQQIIAVTSSAPGEGKSTTVANLAVGFARAGHRVVVVSYDFRRPRLHQFFGLDNQIGVTSVLLQEASLLDCICRVPGEPNLKVLPSGPVPPNPAEILSLDRVRQLLEALAENADVVIVDCPPVLPVADALLIARLCDTMLVVTAAASTKKADLNRTYELLTQVQAPVKGTIVNRVPHRGGYAPDYGYGYGYGYGYDSGQGPAGAGLTVLGRGPNRAPAAPDEAAPNRPGRRRVMVDRLSIAEAERRARSRADAYAPEAALREFALEEPGRYVPAPDDSAPNDPAVDGAALGLPAFGNPDFAEPRSGDPGVAEPGVVGAPQTPRSEGNGHTRRNPSPTPRRGGLGN